jgi:hypothetical protein
MEYWNNGVLGYNKKISNKDKRDSELSLIFISPRFRMTKSNWF